MTNSDEEPTPIRTRCEYDALFQGTPESPDRQAKALAQALDIRNFEIELYWKRTTYFWTLNAAALAGFFALADADAVRALDAQFIVSCLGFVLSLGWYLATRGSKFWQENWERHVDLLEDSVMGPLYKTSLDPKSAGFWELLGPYSISTSKVNQALSLYMLLVWIYLAAVSFPAATCLSEYRCLGPYAFLAGTLIFLAASWVGLRRQEHHSPFEIEMKRRHLKPSAQL